uniref:BTB domain-containing protein n=1 Tax=Eutreptiella gymnastica TaxID=73025 RepID=A0A7S4GII1_9EUGL
MPECRREQYNGHLLGKLLHNAQLADHSITIVDSTSSKTFPVVAAVLAASSQHFFDTFFGSGKHFDKSVAYDDFPGGVATFELVLDFIHGMEIIITEENAVALLAASRFLFLEELTSCCMRFLQMPFQWDDSLRILSASLQFKEEEIVTFMVHNCSREFWKKNPRNEPRFSDVIFLPTKVFVLLVEEIRSVSPEDPSYDEESYFCPTDDLFLDSLVVYYISHRLPALTTCSSQFAALVCLCKKFAAPTLTVLLDTLLECSAKVQEDQGNAELTDIAETLASHFDNAERCHMQQAAQLPRALFLPFVRRLQQVASCLDNVAACIAFHQQRVGASDDTLLDIIVWTDLSVPMMQQLKAAEYHVPATRLLEGLLAKVQSAGGTSPEKMLSPTESTVQLQPEAVFPRLQLLEETDFLTKRWLWRCPCDWMLKTSEAEEKGGPVPCESESFLCGEHWWNIMAARNEDGQLSVFLNLVSFGDLEEEGAIPASFEIALQNRTVPKCIKKFSVHKFSSTNPSRGFSNIHPVSVLLDSEAGYRHSFPGSDCDVLHIEVGIAMKESAKRALERGLDEESPSKMSLSTNGYRFLPWLSGR